MMRNSEQTQMQLNELAAMGVSISLDDFGTGYSSLGYLFSRPLPVDELAVLLLEQRMLAAVAVPPQVTRTLLLVDDEPGVLHALERAFRREGYRILLANSARQALELLSVNDVQVVLSDQRMPHMDGTEFLARARDLYPQTVRMILSGYADLTTIQQAINRGAIYKFLSKPWDDDELRKVVREAFAQAERHRSQRQMA
jgi:response regulator RpfG family c-di-GMP phosphodiesterase